MGRVKMWIELGRAYLGRDEGELEEAVLRWGFLHLHLDLHFVEHAERDAVDAERHFLPRRNSKSSLANLDQRWSPLDKCAGVTSRRLSWSWSGKRGGRLRCSMFHLFATVTLQVVHGRGIGGRERRDRRRRGRTVYPTSPVGQTNW